MENQMLPLKKAIESQAMFSLTAPDPEEFSFVGQRYIRNQDLQLTDYSKVMRHEDLDGMNYWRGDLHIDDQGQCWEQSEGGPLMPWTRITNGLAFERCYDLITTGK